MWWLRKLCFPTILGDFFFQGSQIFVFGGTSPYNGPPIRFTPTQLQFMPEQMRIGEQLQLIDHSDMFVLDLQPSLKTLCIDALTSKWREEQGDEASGGTGRPVDWKALAGYLPRSLVQDLTNATVPNNVSEPLPLAQQG